MFAPNTKEIHAANERISFWYSPWKIPIAALEDWIQDERKIPHKKLKKDELLILFINGYIYSIDRNDSSLFISSSKLKNKKPRLNNRHPIFLFLLELNKVKPNIKNKGTKWYIFKLIKKEVHVVPTFEPMIITNPFLNDIYLLEIRAKVITVMAFDDWHIIVVMIPTINAAVFVLVATLKMVLILLLEKLIRLFVNTFKLVKNSIK